MSFTLHRPYVGHLLSGSPLPELVREHFHLLDSVCITSCIRKKNPKNQT